MTALSVTNHRRAAPPLISTPKLQFLSSRASRNQLPKQKITTARRQKANCACAVVFCSSSEYVLEDVFCSSEYIGLLTVWGRKPREVLASYD